MSDTPEQSAVMARSEDEPAAGFSLSEERKEEELAGVLEELQLPLSTSSAVEQEEVEELGPLMEAEVSAGGGGIIRRRKRRRRSKKASE